MLGVAVMSHQLASINVAQGGAVAEQIPPVAQTDANMSETHVDTSDATIPLVVKTPFVRKSRKTRENDAAIPAVPDDAGLLTKAGNAIMRWAYRRVVPRYREREIAAQERERRRAERIADAENGNGTAEDDGYSTSESDEDEDIQLGLQISEGDILIGDLMSLLRKYEESEENPMLGLAVYEIPPALSDRFMEYGAMWTMVNTQYYELAVMQALRWISVNPSGVIGGIHNEYRGDLHVFANKQGRTSLEPDHPLAGTSISVSAHDMILTKKQRLWESLTMVQKQQIIITAIEMFYIITYDQLLPLIDSSPE